MTDNHRIHVGNNMTPGELALVKDVAEVAAQSAVDRTLVGLGIDPKNPIEAQKMFGALRTIADGIADSEAVADREWAHRACKLSEGMFGKAILTAVAISVVGEANADVGGADRLAAAGALRATPCPSKSSSSSRPIAPRLAPAGTPPWISERRKDGSTGCGYMIGDDHRSLVIKCPDGHDWMIDLRARNCTMKDESTHHCWVRHGRPEDGTLHVDKNGLTCDAGAGSIDTGTWHGFLHNGELKVVGMGQVSASCAASIAPLQPSVPGLRRDACHLRQMDLFDGNLDRPSFSPSVKITGKRCVIANGEWTGEWVRDANCNAADHCCHYFPTAGELRFCSDSVRMRSQGETSHCLTCRHS